MPRLQVPCQGRRRNGIQKQKASSRPNAGAPGAAFEGGRAVAKHPAGWRRPVPPLGGPLRVALLYSNFKHAQASGAWAFFVRAAFFYFNTKTFPWRKRGCLLISLRSCGIYHAETAGHAKTGSCIPLTITPPSFWQTLPCSAVDEPFVLVRRFAIPNVFRVLGLVCSIIACLIPP